MADINEGLDLNEHILIEDIFPKLPVADVCRVSLINHLWRRSALKSLEDRKNVITLELSDDGCYLKDVGDDLDGATVKSLKDFASSPFVGCVTGLEVSLTLTQKSSGIWRHFCDYVAQRLKSLRCLRISFDMLQMISQRRLYALNFSQICSKVTVLKLVNKQAVVTQNNANFELLQHLKEMDGLRFLSTELTCFNAVFDCADLNTKTTLKTLKLKALDRDVDMGANRDWLNNDRYVGIPTLSPFLTWLTVDFKYFFELEPLAKLVHLKQLNLIQLFDRNLEGDKYAFVEDNQQVYLPQADRYRKMKDDYEIAVYETVTSLDISLMPRKLTSEAIYYFTAKFPNLKSLRLKSERPACSKPVADDKMLVEIDALVEIAERGKMPHLENLEIDAPFLAFCKPNFQAKYVENVVTVAAGCTFNLKNFSLLPSTYWTGLNGDHFAKVLEANKAMETISCCMAYSSEAETFPVIKDVFNAIKGHKNLKKVYIDLCSNPQEAMTTKRMPVARSLEITKLARYLYSSGTKLISKDKCKRGGERQAERYAFVGQRDNINSNTTQKEKLVNNSQNGEIIAKKANDCRFWLYLSKKGA